MNKSPFTEAEKRTFKHRRETMLELYAELPDVKQEVFRQEYPTGAESSTIDKMIERLKELKHGS